eukprot:TRINITY_DN32568_c0_g1_i1.p1 TRINITY_DN32568_c0_g1~~TRINITY_DN32568_c0_g1_i1.p1  ORF type:complete len:656 (-),score=37.66 TRINITY_DN32568_c0_g1_i1:106-2073(-)
MAQEVSVVVDGDEKVPFCGCAVYEDEIEKEDAYVLLASLMFLHKMAFEAFDTKQQSQYQEQLKDYSPSMEKIGDPERELIQALVCPKVNFSRWTRWEHFDRLQKVWRHSKFTSEKITDIIDVIGPHANNFVHALTVRVPSSILKTRELQFEDRRRPVISRPGGALAANRRGSSTEFSSPHDLDKESMDMVEAMVPLKPKRPSCTGSMPRKVQLQLHYSGVGRLFDYVELRHHSLDHLLVSLCLANSRIESKLFATAFGQGKVYNCWQVAFPRFLFQRFMDVCSQIALSFFAAPVCHSTRDDLPLWPERYELLILAFFGTRGIVIILIELSVILVEPANVRRRFLSAYLNTYCMMCVIIEIWVFAYTVRMLQDYWHYADETERKERIQNTVLHSHPMHFAMIIFAKWIQFMLSLLNFEALSETFLPAWHAIKCSSSVVFLSYLVLISLGSTLSYYALPIGDISLGEYEKCFFRMFRLTFMGDLDMWQNEGVDQRITNFHLKGQVDSQCRGPDCAHDLTYGTIGDGDKIRNIHNDLRLFECALALLFPVILLNVYVGIVGSAYQDAKDNLLHVQGQFRMSSSFRLLLQRQFWLRRCWGIFSLDFSLGKVISIIESMRRASARADTPDEHEPPSVWITVPTARIIKPLDSDAAYMAWM